jgi:hypothetical protein
MQIILHHLIATVLVAWAAWVLTILLFNHGAHLSDHLPHREESPTGRAFDCYAAVDPMPRVAFTTHAQTGESSYSPSSSMTTRAAGAASTTNAGAFWGFEDDDCHSSDGECRRSRRLA